MKNASIATTLLDVEIGFKLPARWGNEYQINSIEKIYLNGKQALCLNLSPLKNPDYDVFVTGSHDLEEQSDNQYYYMPVAQNPTPLSNGSSWGFSKRVSECRIVLRKAYTKEEESQGFTWRWILHWRISFTSRRDPVLALPPSSQ